MMIFILIAPVFYIIIMDIIDYDVLNRFSQRKDEPGISIQGLNFVCFFSFPPSKNKNLTLLIPGNCKMGEVLVYVLYFGKAGRRKLSIPGS